MEDVEIEDDTQEDLSQNVELRNSDDDPSEDVHAVEGSDPVQSGDDNEIGDKAAEESSPAESEPKGPTLEDKLAERIEALETAQGDVDRLEGELGEVN